MKKLPFLKPIMLKLERATILTDSADRALIKALRPPGVNLQSDLDLASNLAGEALDDFFDNQAHIFVRPLWVYFNPTIVTREGVFDKFRFNDRPVNAGMRCIVPGRGRSRQW